MSKFTPGPWLVQGHYSEEEAGLAVIAVHEDVPIGGTPTRGMVAWSSQLLPELAPECEANAALISAAPDLYAALIKMVGRWEPDCDGSDRRMYEDALAALAKAEGTHLTQGA